MSDDEVWTDTPEDADYQAAYKWKGADPHFIVMDEMDTADPLAEALRVEYERWSRDLNRKETWEQMAARVARDHTAAEIEAAIEEGDSSEDRWENGMNHAARIARGDEK